MTSLKVQKDELRAFIRTQKKLLSTEDYKILSDRALRALEELQVFKNATTILLYHSLPDEVDTHDFISKWSPFKRILLPTVKRDELELRVYKDVQDLQTGSYGIQESTGDVFSDYNEIDCVLVPGMAFDREGDRLGRGKGYYDRLLSRLPAIKIGICFPFQLVEQVPTDECDIRMDMVITGVNEK